MYAKLALTAFLASRIAATSVVPSDSDLIPNNDIYDDIPLYADYDNSVLDANELDNTIPMHAEDRYNEPNEYSYLTPRAEHGSKKHYKADPKFKTKASSEIQVPKKAGQKSKAKSHHMAGPVKPGHRKDQGSHKYLDPGHENRPKFQKKLSSLIAPGIEIPYPRTMPHSARPTGSRTQPMRQPGPFGTNTLNGLPVPRSPHSTKHFEYFEQPKHSL